MSAYPQPYFQTTPMSGQALADAIRSAAKQNEAILAVFMAGIARSPSQVHSILTRMGRKWPLPSVRRGITTLQKAGALVKLCELRTGPWGAKEHLWIRSDNQSDEPGDG
jgi:hypothetical protein